MSNSHLEERSNRIYIVNGRIEPKRSLVALDLVLKLETTNQAGHQHEDKDTSLHPGQQHVGPTPVETQGLLEIDPHDAITAITYPIDAFRIQSSPLDLPDADPDDLRDLALGQVSRRRVVHQCHAEYQILAFPHIVIVVIHGRRGRNREHPLNAGTEYDSVPLRRNLLDRASAVLGDLVLCGGRGTTSDWVSKH